MFDNITDAERQNSRRTEPAFLKARKSKFFHHQAQSEAEDSNGSHANDTDIIEAVNSKSTGDSFFNSYWFGVVVVLVFLFLVFVVK